MATLSTARIAELLQPFYPDPAQSLLGQLSAYLDLLLKWNGKTNLTAIREPEQMVIRHFGESLFCAALLPGAATTLLDLGSGAGFPGLPIALARPGLLVTLAESQGKKSAFLREALRTLGATALVWPHRSQQMPPARLFDVVTLRAVDDEAQAMPEARSRVAPGGLLIRFATGQSEGEEPGAAPSGVDQDHERILAIPGSDRRVLRLTRC